MIIHQQSLIKYQKYVKTPITTEITTETSLLITRYYQSNDAEKRCLGNTPKVKNIIPPLIEQHTIKLLDVKILKFV